MRGGWPAVVTTSADVVPELQGSRLRWFSPMECVETTCAVDMAAPFGSFESDMRDERGVTDKAAVAVVRFRTNLKTD